MGHPRLVVFVRCHCLAPFVVDTIDSIRHYSVSNPTVVVTVDRNEELGEYVKEHRPDTKVFVCKKKCGWGAGMYRLLCESLRWLLDSGIEFDYVMNMDYDLIFTREGADVKFLPYFSSPEIGVVGKINKRGSYWKRKVRMYLPKLISVLGRVNKTLPKGYVVGEHTAGAWNILSRQCVLKMYGDGFLSSPVSDVCDWVPIADDPLLSFFVVCAGYKLGDIGENDSSHIVWQFTGDLKTITNKGCYLFHPTKIVPGNQRWSVQAELECRNYFRALRGEKPLIMDGLPATAGPVDMVM